MDSLKKFSTPIETATQKEINTPDDIINGWEGASKLIYCWKNNLDLIKWQEMLSDEFIYYCKEKEFLDLNDKYTEDFYQIGLYLELMKNNDWFSKVHEDRLIKNIEMVLRVMINLESINREIRKNIGDDFTLIKHHVGKNKWDIEKYSSQLNPEYNYKKVKK